MDYFKRAQKIQDVRMPRGEMEPLNGEYPEFYVDSTMGEEGYNQPRFMNIALIAAAVVGGLYILTKK